MLSYDGRGNVSAAGGVGYAYTAENRLGYTGAAGGTAMLHEPGSGLMFAQQSPGSDRRYAWMGDALALEIDGATGGIVRRHVAGPGIDETLVTLEGAGTTDRRWLLQDERGSTVGVTDGQGAVTNKLSYDDYGTPASSNPATVRFQYTGQAWLPELNMHYYKARLMNPAIGRFMQSDPIGYAGGVNLYAYVGGDPVNFTDPSGHGIITDPDGSNPAHCSPHPPQ